MESYSPKQRSIIMGIIVGLLSLMIVLIFYLNGALRNSAIGIFAFIVVGLTLTGIWLRRAEVGIRRSQRQQRNVEGGMATAIATEADMGLDEPLPKYVPPPKYETNNTAQNQPAQNQPAQNQPAQTVQ